MESQFLNAIQQNDAEVLKRCLRIYASVERISDAERLLRSRIISPYLEDVITSKNLHSDPMGLSGICQNILAIIPDKLDLLLKLTNRKKTISKKGSRLVYHQNTMVLLKKCPYRRIFLLSFN